MTFKLIQTDNYGGDYPNEKEVCFKDSQGNYLPVAFANAEQAQTVCDAFNDVLSGEMHPRIYMVKPAAYQLQGGFEP